MIFGTQVSQYRLEGKEFYLLQRIGTNFLYSSISMNLIELGV